MADLPFSSHRYLIEPLAGCHFKTRLMKSYLNFIKRVRESSKPVLRQLYQLVSSDVRTVTGSNLTNILLLTEQVEVDKLEPSMIDNIPYHRIKKEDMWRISMVMELMDIKQGVMLAPEGMSIEDLEHILESVCTQ